MDRKNVFTVANDISEATFQAELKVMRERAARIYRRLHINQTFLAPVGGKRKSAMRADEPRQLDD